MAHIDALRVENMLDGHFQGCLAAPVAATSAPSSCTLQKKPEGWQMTVFLPRMEL